MKKQLTTMQKIIGYPLVAGFAIWLFMPSKPKEYAPFENAELGCQTALVNSGIDLGDIIVSGNHDHGDNFKIDMKIKASPGIVRKVECIADGSGKVLSVK